jgi:hypothetical protein
MLREQFWLENSEILRTLNETKVIQFDDGLSTDMQLIVAPISLITRNYQTETKQSNQPGEYVMYLAVVRSQPESQLKIFTIDGFFKSQFWLIIVLVASIVMAAFCIFQTSHIVIRPLRQLNSKMREILESKASREISADQKSD